MEISVGDLYTIIGKQQVHIEVLTQQIEMLKKTDDNRKEYVPSVERKLEAVKQG